MSDGHFRYGPFGEMEVKLIAPQASGAELRTRILTTLYDLPFNETEMVEAVREKTCKELLAQLTPHIHGSYRAVDGSARGFALGLQEQCDLTETRLGLLLMGAEAPVSVEEDEIVTLHRYADSLTLLREMVTNNSRESETESQATSGGTVRIEGVTERAITAAHERFSHLVGLWINNGLIMPRNDVGFTALAYVLTDEQFDYFSRSRNALGRDGSGTRGLLLRSFVDIFGTRDQADKFRTNLESY